MLQKAVSVMANSADPDQTVPLRNSLIRVALFPSIFPVQTFRTFTAILYWVESGEKIPHKMSSFMQTEQLPILLSRIPAHNITDCEDVLPDLESCGEVYFRVTPFEYLSIY